MILIWRSRKKSPNQIPSILNPAALAGWLATQVPGIITIAVPPLQEEYLYTPQRMQCWGFLSLSPERKLILLTRVRGRSKPRPAHAPTCSNAVSPQSQVKENEYTPKERAKTGRYGTENGPSKVNRHFSL